MKVCNKCKIEKEPNDFSKDKYNKDALNTICKECKKECKKEYKKEYYINNNIEINENTNKYYYNNIEKIKEYKYVYYIENKEEILKYANDYYNDNIEVILEYKKEYNKENKNEILIKNKIYREENKEELKIRKRKYSKNNKEKRNEYYRYKYKNDSLFHLKENIRVAIRNSYSKNKLTKSYITEEILSCSLNYLIEHLNNNEYVFIFGDVNIDIDHIIPISSAECEEDLIYLNNYTNLQLLPCEYNRYIKRDKTFDEKHFKDWLYEHI